MSLSNTQSSNGTDIYSTTTRFSQAVATTAHALINTPDGSDALLSNSSYKKALRDALHPGNSTALQKRNSNMDLGQSRFASSSEYFKNKFTSSKAAYKVLTHISDDLLQDVPEEKPSSFSLFQGFNAALPAIDEEIELNKNLKDGGDFLKSLTSSAGDDKDEELTFKLPNGLTKEKINDSYSTSRLTQYKSTISDNLDLLEIRKNLAASEIIEIDNKVAKLQELRKVVFKRVAKLEQNEMFLESHLEDINDRIQMLKDYNMERPETDEDNENDDDEEQQKKDTNDTTTTDEDESREETPDVENSPLLSQSIYGKLQERPPVFKRKTPRVRKTTPTLQQYYEPGTEIKTVQAHEESVNCFDFDIPFGTLVSASLDNTVRVWDMSRGKCLGLLEGHNASVQCIQMEGTLAVTGSLDATLKLWDLSRMGDDEGPLIHSFESHIEEITALSFHNYNLVSGSQDRTMRQWDMQTGHCLQTIDVLWASQANMTHSVDATSLLVDKTSPFIGALQTYDAALATGTSDGMVRLWDLRSGEMVRSLVGHTGPVTCLQFDDKHLATGSKDRSIRIWDLRTGGIHDAFAYESPITSLHFDSRRIVSSNMETTAKIYDRLDEKHSSCGGKDESSAIINHVRYKEGYLVEGRADGKIGMWAI